ncbi:MAG: hypothetical protein WCK92_07930 [Bacteroidota bacterium]
METNINKIINKKVILDSDYNNCSVNLIKYIIEFFGFKDVQVNLEDGLIIYGDDEKKKFCKTLYINSLNREVYELVKNQFNHLFDSTEVTEDGILEMSKKITYKKEEKSVFLPYILDWEQELDNILFVSISIFLKPLKR